MIKNDNNNLMQEIQKLKRSWLSLQMEPKGEKGDKVATPKVTTARGADGRQTLTLHLQFLEEEL